MIRSAGAVVSIALLCVTGRAFADDDAPYEAEEPIEVNVEGDKAPPGATSLGRRHIQETPGILNDPYRAIETEPGVTPAMSGVPFYFIRGAPPGNIGYFFDGIQVPFLFHVGAGPGVIPPGLVERVEFAPGPYAVTRGRFAGAVVDADMVPPRDEWRGEGALRVVDVGGLVEGPLPDQRGSLLIGGHYSLGAAILSAAVPSIDLGYWDYQGRASIRTSARGRFTVLGFGAYDYLAAIDGEVTDTLLDSDFHRLDVRYDHELEGGGTLRLGTTLGLDRSRGAGVKEAAATRLSTRIRVDRPLSSQLLLRAGLDLGADIFDVTPGGSQECTTFVCEGGPLGPSTEDELAEAFRVLFPSRTDLAVSGWVDLLIVLGERATLTPGLRLDHYASLGSTALGVDPRLFGRFGVTDHFRFVNAVGMASQLPGFPPLPGLQIGGIPGGLQRALQTSFGAEGDVGPIEARGGVFRSGTFGLTDAIGAERGTRFGAQRFLNRSQGDAYGIELAARGALHRHIFFLASYTLSRTTRERDGLTLPSAYDRTHVGQVALLFDLGRNWRAGTRTLFYTGFPADEAGVGRIPSTHPDRVKPFFRLDARFSKRWIWDDGVYLGLVFDMQNALLSREVFDVTCDDDGCSPREIGPITIPTLALEAGF